MTLRTRFAFWLARHFGERLVGYDDNGRVATAVVGAMWRGRLYILSTTFAPSARPDDA